LFAEAIEAADPRPIEGIRSTGGTAAQEFRYGALPQALPVIAGQILYYFESNTRSATIIGIVGAGGIGLHLSEQIRTLEWPRVAFIIIMILVVVAAIDALSSRLRGMIAGARPV
jgi:phosphonate transport system permease protein